MDFHQLARAVIVVATGSAIAELRPGLQFGPLELQTSRVRKPYPGFLVQSRVPGDTGLLASL